MLWNIDDLIGDGLSPQMVEDLMSSTGALYGPRRFAAVRKAGNLTAVSIGERGRARLLSISLPALMNRRLR